MPLPHNNELRRPILKLLSDGQLWRKSQLIEPLAQHFNLNEDERNAEYPSGNGNIFADKISWVLSYHALTGLLLRPKRGVYQISELGKAYAVKSDAEIVAFVKEQMALRNKDTKTENFDEVEPNLDPREQLEQSFRIIRQAVYDEILETIISKTANAFEKLVIDLLKHMGYGGKVEKSAIVTKQSRDGGIDGEIREDVLGLGRIFIQAKRYQHHETIGRPAIQTFAGAINPQDKGVFITTARYSKDALEYAQNRSSPRLVLIDGQQLAEYIYHYGLGMQTEQIFSIKKLDSDFWDEMPDDMQKGK
ncbi:restriction endonuclease [Conchiformibius kuhniae]|uniref:Restriction endonuclease n=1 Tax=Conchiformibius kuhniae TaxID=211502 RepID=A0A8T9MSE4_9NEIS|nr:restriction endonuclease [Conchiformibius kuhniae]UOP04820.1 restriction endonuclease [Conchiformibius kuhniae]